MKKLNALIVLLAAVIISMPLIETALTDEGVIIPFTFKNGEVADADQVNAVIAAIETSINCNLITMWDYGAPVGTSKTFEHTYSTTTLTTVVTGDGIETWSYSDGSKVEYLTADSPEGTLETGRRIYNTDGSLYQDLTYFPAVIGVDLAGPKEVGKIWGNAYAAKKPDGSRYGEEIHMYSIIGIETVIVPAGTFENCTKVFTTTGNYSSVAWYAEGVGMVKRMGPNPDIFPLKDGVMELQSY